MSDDHPPSDLPKNNEGTSTRIILLVPRISDSDDPEQGGAKQSSHSVMPTTEVPARVQDRKNKGKRPASAVDTSGRKTSSIAHVVYRQQNRHVKSLRVVVKTSHRASSEDEVLRELLGQHHLPLLLSSAQGELVLPYYSDRSVHSLFELARLTSDVADALAFLHQAGWVHCDVKRANVRFTDTGAVLIDLDLARRWRVGDAPLTGKVGTPGWMAPEVSCSGLYTSAADLFGLGMVILDELLKLNYGLEGIKMRSVCSMCLTLNCSGRRLLFRANKPRSERAAV